MIDPLIEKWLGEEYCDEMSLEDNITTLVDEVQHFRKLMKLFRVFVVDLDEWIKEYDDVPTEVAVNASKEDEDADDSEDEAD